MGHVAFLAALVATSFGAGVVGAVLGLGGGILLVPLLTMVFGVDLHYAMGASLISVIATSSGAAAIYLRSGLSNIRIGLFLAMATVTGALIGAALSGIVPALALELILGLALSYSVVVTLRQLKDELPGACPTIRSRCGSVWRACTTTSDSAGRCSTAPNVSRRVRGHVGRGRALRHARHRQRRVQGARAGLPDAPAHEGLHRDQQLHDRADRGGQRGHVLRPRRHPRADRHPGRPVGVMLAAPTVGTALMGRLRNTTVRALFLPVIVYLALSMIARGLGWGAS